MQTQKGYSRYYVIEVEATNSTEDCRLDARTAERLIAETVRDDIIGAGCDYETLGIDVEVKASHTISHNDLEYLALTSDNQQLQKFCNERLFLPKYDNDQ